MAARQAPPSLGFSRQEHWSGLPFPSLQNHHTVFQRRCNNLHSCQQWMSSYFMFVPAFGDISVLNFGQCILENSNKWSYSGICFNLHFPMISAEKAMAPHSSTLAWKIPWTEEPGRLQSMGSLGVGHDWATSLSLFTFMHWRRKWQPIPVFLPGESQGQGSLVGCRLWGHTESDMTEAT